MKMIKTFVLLLFSSASLLAQNNSANCPVKEKLGHPLGTMFKLKVAIVDGDSMNMKYYQSAFLVKVTSVNDTVLSKPVIMEFKDETGKIPNEVFGLYELFYGRKTGTIDQEENKKIKKNYVGKTFEVMAYETGGFTGTPRNYAKNGIVPQDRGFHFLNYLVMVEESSK